MNNSLKIILKKYLDDKEYEKYNDFLRKEIISIFVKKIQEKNPEFLYSTVVELLECAEKELLLKDVENIKRFYNILKENHSSEVLSTLLTEIYEEIM